MVNTGLGKCFTSAKEVGFSPMSACLLVGWDVSSITQTLLRISMKLKWRMGLSLEQAPFIVVDVVRYATFCEFLRE